MGEVSVYGVEFAIYLFLRLQILTQALASIYD